MNDRSRAWRSSLTAESIAAATGSISEPRVNDRGVYWLQSLPAEDGRVAVMAAAAGRAAQALVPAPYSVRSRVNEYGGGEYVLASPALWFVNGADQGLYRRAGGRIARVCQADGLCFADLAWDGVRRRVLAVAEDYRGAGPARQRLVAVDEEGRISVLAEGADFYAAPRVSPDGANLAWLEWSEPDMPWDATRLLLANVGADGVPRDARTVGGAELKESFAQPDWSPDGALYAVSDRDGGFWNLHRIAPEGPARVRRAPAECARPAFVFAQDLYAFTPEGGLLLAEAQDGLWRVLEGSRDGSGFAPRLPALTEIAAVAAGPAGTAVVGGGADQPLALFFRPRNAPAFERVATSCHLDLEPGYVSRARPFEFDTAGGGRAHALYFPPAHPRESAAGPVPVRVRCHGGPTSSASSALEPRTLFWTSRGFAALELDYRGSSGYGRTYREALYGAWGVADVQDAQAAARALVAAGHADAARLVVAGASAGGLTVLAALAGESPFAAGASHYGVADLTRLMQNTHRFEAHYGEQLVGPWPRERALYEARSPLNRVGEIARPVIFFQGLADPVVPPGQSERMARALAARGITVAYETFAGERHGFRRPENVARALAAELAFYARVLDLAVGETPVEPAWLET